MQNTSRALSSTTRKLLLPILLAGVLSACTPPVIRMPQTPDMQAWDQETEYKLTPTASGFNIKLNHLKVQYAPEMGVVVAKCKDATAAIAQDYAEQQRRKIKPVVPERIQYTTDRNMSGTTSCSASYTAEWAAAEMPATSTATPVAAPQSSTSGTQGQQAKKTAATKTRKKPESTTAK